MNNRRNLSGNGQRTRLELVLSHSPLLDKNCLTAILQA